MVFPQNRFNNYYIFLTDLLWNILIFWSYNNYFFRDKDTWANNEDSVEWMISLVEEAICL